VGVGHLDEMRREGDAVWAVGPYPSHPYTGPVLCLPFSGGLAVLPGGRCRQPRHNLIYWPGHKPSWVVPCLGWAKKTDLVLDNQASGCMLIYTRQSRLQYIDIQTIELELHLMSILCLI
jgi:hypothetical protein